MASVSSSNLHLVNRKVRCILTKTKSYKLDSEHRALPICMTVDGQDSLKSALESVKSDKLPADGVGKRQCGALTIVYKADQAGAVQALSPDQVLQGVKLEFSRSRQDGTNNLYYSVDLTNVKVVSIAPSPSGSERRVTMEYERIDFTYLKIIVKWVDGTTIRKHDWV